MKLCVKDFKMQIRSNRDCEEEKDGNRFSESGCIAGA